MGISPTNFKTYYIIRVIKRVWYLGNKRYTQVEWTRQTRSRLIHIWPITFLQRCKGNSLWIGKSLQQMMFRLPDECKGKNNFNPASHQTQKLT